MQQQQQQSHTGQDMRPYRRLALSLGISYIVMLTVMFSRVDVPGNIFLSLNQLYMTGLMIAPMLIIMLLVMGPMYPNKRLNRALLGGGVLLAVLFWTLLRTQTGVGNQQFLRSMIPHHAAAILVCHEAALTEPRIQELCEEIVAAQEREIREMKEIMAELEGRE